jgi:hypothetical protein
VSVRGRLLTGSLLGFAALAVALLPFALLLLPNPGPVRVASPAEAGPGAYAGTDAAWFRQFPYASPPASFPRGVPVVPASSRLVLRTRTPEDADASQLAPYPRGKPVTVRRVSEGTRVVTLVPAQPLPPGRYVLRAPRGGLYPGTDLYYVRVSAEATAP